MRKIKAKDEVIVIAGRDKGKRGTVDRVLDDYKAIVSGINMVKKHVKPNPQRGTEGGIVEKEMPIQLSNLAIFNPDTGKADRVGFQFVEKDGKRVKTRIYKSTKAAITATDS